MSAVPARRGYTVVEIMISLAILAIGASGIIAMQKVAAVANRDSKNLVIANQIARTWVERLRADATKWNHPSAFLPTSDLGETEWLKLTPDTVNLTWLRPADGVLGSFTADAFGNDVTPTDPTAAYCTNLRLTWLYGPPSAGVPPPYLIRAEIRVFWIREGGGGALSGGLCPANMGTAAVDTALANYHFVYVTTALTQNMAR